MNGVEYVIPDLAVVSVHASVSELVRSSIDFQLGHFATTAKPLPQFLAKIVVRPYADYHDAEGSVVFHGMRSWPGKVLQSDSSRHATVRTEEGFSVFTDSPQVLIVLLLQVLALRCSRTFLHAAGWCDPSGAVTLLPGPGGVGKTALLAAAVLRHNARVLGDDLILVGGGRAAAFPRAFVLKEYHRTLFPNAFATIEQHSNQKSTSRLALRLLRENMPFHGLAKSLFRRAGKLETASSWIQSQVNEPEFHTVAVKKLFGESGIAAGGSVARVVYLERYAGDTFRRTPLSVEVAVSRSLAVLHHEWADYLRWYCSLGAVEMVDLADHFRSTEEAMRSAFAQAEIALFQVPEKASPEKLEGSFAAQVGFSTG